MQELYKWSYMASLEQPKEISGGGVYLLVYCGTPKRVIYVGTTNSFNRRIGQHQKGMIRGNRSVWRTNKESDIYDLMSFKGEKGMHEYYYSLAKKGLLWASTTIERQNIKNDLNKSDDFIPNWKEYVINSYIKNIEVWVCKMEADIEKIVALESHIQRMLKKNYSIGSHIHNEGMCWLGKIEFTGDISNERFDFDNFPEISEEFKLLLSKLDGKNYIRYEKQKYIDCRNEREKINFLLRKKYKFENTSWQDKEQNLLLSCLKLDISINEIADEYLQRSPEEIIKRIEYLSKYYDFPKFKLE